MSRKLWIILIIVIVLLVAMTVAIVSLWWSVKSQPAWYTDRVQIDTKKPEVQESGREMEQRIARVVSGFEKSGKWEVVFTEEQINSYFAGVLLQKHPELLPPELHDPRVMIEPDGLTIAARIEEPIETVISLKVDVYLPEPNTIAVQICQIRAGRLPWSLDRLQKELSVAAERGGVPLTWARSEKGPIAMIKLVPSDPKKVTRITACQLGDHKLYLAGTTQKRSK